MTPAEAIAALDRALGEAGEDVALRRIVGTGANTANVDVTCRALVRSVKPEEIVGTIVQTDQMVILSPSDIDRAQWPGGQPDTPGLKPDARIPRVNDKVVVQSKVRNITLAKPIVMEGVLVRVELIAGG
jgi:hypothetical protein